LLCLESEAIADMKIYDISRDLREGMTVWPGDQKFRCRWISRLRDGDPCNVSAITMSVHAGTHVDGPLHYDDLGADVASVPLQAYVGPAKVISLTVDGCIRASDLSGMEWHGVERVLFKTQSGPLQIGRFNRNYIFLSEDAAEFLVWKGIMLAGMDAPSVDAYDSKSMPAHRILLEHGVAILEWARLEDVPAGDYVLICLPLKLAGLDGSPVRAILIQR
jgi:arylformamidase